MLLDSYEHRPLSEEESRSTIFPSGEQHHAGRSQRTQSIIRKEKLGFSLCEPFWFARIQCCVHRRSYARIEDYVSGTKQK